MHRKKAPHFTFDNVTFVSFAPTYEGSIETAEQVEMRLMALSQAAAARMIRKELELALRLIAWAQESKAGNAYETVCAELRDRIADIEGSSQAPLRA
jgi:hypothetical protein